MCIAEMRSERPACVCVEESERGTFAHFSSSLCSSRHSIYTALASLSELGFTDKKHIWYCSWACEAAIPSAPTHWEKAGSDMHGWWQQRQWGRELRDNSRAQAMRSTLWNLCFSYSLDVFLPDYICMSKSWEWPFAVPQSTRHIKSQQKTCFQSTHGVQILYQ